MSRGDAPRCWLVALLPCTWLTRRPDLVCCWYWLRSYHHRRRWYRARARAAATAAATRYHRVVPRRRNHHHHHQQQQQLHRSRGSFGAVGVSEPVVTSDARRADATASPAAAAAAIACPHAAALVAAQEQRHERDSASCLVVELGPPARVPCGCVVINGRHSQRHNGLHLVLVSGFVVVAQPHDRGQARHQRRRRRGVPRLGPPIHGHTARARGVPALRTLVEPEARPRAQALRYLEALGTTTGAARARAQALVALGY